MYYAGIDPGFSGALAILDPVGGLVAVSDTPVVGVKFVKNGKQRTRQVFVVESMRALLLEYSLTCVFIEDVSARPGQGVTSMFRFGHGMGLWEGLMHGLQIAYRKILPVMWKETFDLVGKPKDAARAMMFKRFDTPLLKLKKHQGRADALCMAEFCRRYFAGSASL